ncbi:MAG: hypothetical protein ACETWQ_14450 [Phycisphaerae bacterium]
MNKQRDEKHLDELISRAINTQEPQFDAEKWKQKYPDEYQTLISRASKKAPTHRPNIWRITLRSPIIRIAAAAVIIIAVSFFSIRQDQDKQEQPGIAEVKKSPVEMMTALSLEHAFRRGGIEAVENQCEQALKLLGPRTVSLSSQELLSEFNGS